MINYLESHKEKIQNTPGGSLCQVYGDREGKHCSIALVNMDSSSNGLQHYHKDICEIYLFSKGRGKIIINGNENIINEGDCYIITNNNTHYIEADSNMSFACICTPPWREDREFVSDTLEKCDNVSKYTDLGIIQNLSNDINNNVTLYNINGEFNTDNRNYNRVYYFISGTGTLNSNTSSISIVPGTCFFFSKDDLEYINNANKLRFVVVYE